MTSTDLETRLTLLAEQVRAHDEMIRALRESERTAVDMGLSVTKSTKATYDEVFDAISRANKTLLEIISDMEAFKSSTRAEIEALGKGFKEIRPTVEALKAVTKVLLDSSAKQSADIDGLLGRPRPSAGDRT